MAHKRTSRKRLILLAAGGLGVIVIACAYAALRTPGWYDPPVIVEHERQGVRDSLIAAEQAFTQALRGGTEPFVYHVYQDDLNRWLAMRREIYPLAAEVTPAELQEPYVDFEEGRITVGGRLAAGPTSVVVSIRLTSAYQQGAIVLRADGWRCGSWPVPDTWLGDVWTRPIEREAGKTWPGSPRIWGDLKNGLRIGSDAWWKNGGMEYRVLDVSAAPGVLNLKIEPLGPHFARGRKDQD